VFVSCLSIRYIELSIIGLSDCSPAQYLYPSVVDILVAGLR
jgi:hypothetical protein